MKSEKQNKRQSIFKRQDWAPHKMGHYTTIEQTICKMAGKARINNRNFVA